ncbi:MAG: hypothetical protein JKY90_08010 [Gammaproteobacteria bacterium]|nr:hypothetical protein [Gammaproteobacteria bacterium]
MDEKNKVDGSSRRKFIKIAAATAYVAPLILSMPAQATYTNSGSAQAKKVRHIKKAHHKIHKIHGQAHRYGNRKLNHKIHKVHKRFHYRYNPYL